MKFIADLHIHSRFSIATSKELNVAHLAFWAKRKGIHVLGTGDFTHPAWRAELARDLLFDEESGLYKCRMTDSEDNASAPFFCLQAEISSIYKKNGRTRKIHNLVFVPDLESADRLSARLALIGNINSDGRPILGLDAHDLLELVLENSPRSVLIPAHIWTPWFSLFGSKSGFEHIEECYGDLTPHIFALETGLSSDPAMNRHWSALDSYALISNSDAHSGPNLGREANVFSGPPSYDGLFAALRAQARGADVAGLDCAFLGTCEFYPEEGKYHLDGHRACGVVLEPQESVKKDNICPVCGKPLTIGVLHRVMELADRTAPAPLPNETPSRMLVPLPEVIAQILGQGKASRKLWAKYESCLSELGPEMEILCQLPEAAVRAYWEPLGEAIARLRSGKVRVKPGFDGQYGIIEIFSEEEKRELRQGKIHSLPGMRSERPTPAAALLRETRPLLSLKKENEAQKPMELSPSQLAVVEAGPHPIFVIAGPGAGKTRCLVNRLSMLARTVPATRILALTYTRRAAEEMRSRLAGLFPSDSQEPLCDTLHAVAWKILKEKYPLELMDEARSEALFREANPDLAKREARTALHELNLAREKCLLIPPHLSPAYASYRELKNSDPAKIRVDFCDLLEMLLKEDLRGRWLHILVDEMQDLTPLQLALIQRLSQANGAGFFGIGDPDQAIYSFRGAASDILEHLRSLWNNLEILILRDSWRCGQSILDMARSVLGPEARSLPLLARSRHHPLLSIIEADDERTEAIALARKISSLLGPTAHTLQDLDGEAESLSPSDIAILVRVKAQANIIVRTLSALGIPVSAPAEEEFWHDEACAELLAYARKLENAPPPEELLKEERFAHLTSNDSFTALLRYWRKSASWPRFWEELAWLQEAEMIAANSQSVRILTIHASKGLEFHTVFVPGLEKGLLPLQRDLLHESPQETESMEEEKRLLYVALTRASHAVYISYARKRHIYGREVRLPASPFLESLKNFCRQSSICRHIRPKMAPLPLMNLFPNK